MVWCDIQGVACHILIESMLKQHYVMIKAKKNQIGPCCFCVQISWQQNLSNDTTF
jgi:hypothetical protein